MKIPDYFQWAKCWLGRGLLLLLIQASPAAELEKEDVPLVSYRNGNVSLGKNVHVKSDEHYEQLVVVWGDVLMEGTIEGDLVVINGKVEVTGTVKGDFVAVLSTGRLASTAEVKGHMVSVLGSIREEEGARVQGQKTIINLQFPPLLLGGLKAWFWNGLVLARPLPPQLAWVWLIVGLLSLFYILVRLLFPRPIQACVEALEQNAIASFFTGLLALLLFGPLMFLLVVSLAGILVTPFLICGFLVLGLFGKVALIQYTGLHLGQQTGWALLQRPLVALMIGMALFCLIYMVPLLGFFIWGLAVPFCLGAGVVAIAKGFKHQSSNLPEGSILPPGSASSEFGAPPNRGAAELQMNLLLWPRAGFWIRLGAVAIDLVFLLVVLNLLQATGYFLVVWLIYHVVLWTWRGATIGGTICRLKMVRLDGQPLGFMVALIRCLAAFISALPLGLGFVWSAWDKERQSWHDKIAGSLIIRIPSGRPLI